MPTYIRPKNKRQLRHPASRSRSHRIDKQQGEARKETAWFGVDAPERPSPKRNFHGLTGHEYTHDGQRWKRCQGSEEFADHLESEAKKRSWFMGHTQRKGVAVEMKRRVPPLDTLTTSFAPWLSAWTAAECAAGRDPRPKLGAIRSRWLQAAVKTLAGLRYVLVIRHRGQQFCQICRVISGNHRTWEGTRIKNSASKIGNSMHGSGRNALDKSSAGFVAWEHEDLSRWPFCGRSRRKGVGI